MKYRFFLADDALTAFGSAGPRDRALLCEHFQHLAAFPYDCDITWDADGFDFYAKRFGRWSVTYRVDGAVKHVLILAIDKLTLR